MQSEEGRVNVEPRAKYLNRFFDEIFNKQHVTLFSSYGAQTAFADKAWFLVDFNYFIEFRS